MESNYPVRELSMAELIRLLYLNFQDTARIRPECQTVALEAARRLDMYDWSAEDSVDRVWD
jgi:hypothetical protein